MKKTRLASFISMNWENPLSTTDNSIYFDCKGGEVPRNIFKDVLPNLFGCGDSVHPTQSGYENMSAILNLQMVKYLPRKQKKKWKKILIKTINKTK